MIFEAWHIWVILAILLLIIEIFTITFLSASVAFGCLIAALASYMHFDLDYQLIAFSIGSATAFFGARPFMKKYAYRGGEDVKTNMEALIGQIGRVDEDIDPRTGTGRIIVAGDDWKAEALSNQFIGKGERVRVVSVQSVTLIVEAF